MTSDTFVSLRVPYTAVCHSANVLEHSLSTEVPSDYFFLVAFLWAGGYGVSWFGFGRSPPCDIYVALDVNTWVT